VDTEPSGDYKKLMNTNTCGDHEELMNAKACEEHHNSPPPMPRWAENPPVCLINIIYDHGNNYWFGKT
jgi:hypothetical protein